MSLSKEYIPEFSTLPVEVYDRIFYHLSSTDLLRLLPLSRRFWNVTVRHIEDRELESFGQWANKPIICIGEKTPDPSRFPANLLHMFGESSLQAVLEDQYLKRGPLLPISRDEHEAAYISLLELDGVLSTSRHFPRRLYLSWASIFNHMFRNEDNGRLYPTDRSWVLRNLTTHEYVRSEALALNREDIRGPHIGLIGFGHVVLSRICWSSNPSISMRCNISMHQGIWAGHRFDITPTDELKDSGKSGIKWLDISDDIVAELDEIWTGVLGRKWRQQVLGSYIPYGIPRLI